MSDVTELAQRMSLQRVAEISKGSVLIVGEKECLANTALYLSEELKIATKAFQAAGFAQLDAEEKLESATIRIDALVEALEARDKQIAKDIQIKARLCRESNSLHDRLRDAEKRIAELEARTVKLPLPRRKTADDYVDDTFEPCDLAEIYNACRLECEVKFKKALDAAGVAVERN